MKRQPVFKKKGKGYTRIEGMNRFRKQGKILLREQRKLSRKKGGLNKSILDQSS